MASENEASCDADPNFAVVCAFLEKFGAACGLQTVDFVDLQQMLENVKEVSPVLIDLHIKLLRKIKKSVTAERWERGVVKLCHTYSNQDAWEIERFGYKKARLSVKLRLLKVLLEMQFDNNTSFKNKINLITAKELRSHPIGKDKLGNAYWYQIDDSCQIRVYKEDPDEETWALVAKDRDGLVTLISKLNDNQDSSSTDAVTNEDSNSNNEETKTVLDTGQQDSNSSKKSSDDDKPPQLQQEVNDVDDEDTKMEVEDVKMPELTAPHEEKKPELSGIKEKYIRSDNFIQSNRKAVESAGFVDIGISNAADLKRPLEEELDEPSLVKRPRTARPTLLGNKKKPYQQEEEYDDEEDEIEEEEEEDDEDDQGDDDEDDEDYVGEAIEEPLMLVTGKGSGKDNKCENPIVGEVIEEEVMFFYGAGNGFDCETGNEEKKEQAATEKSSADAGSKDSIISPAKNCYKLGTIIDSKTDGRDRDRSPTKIFTSRWDVGKPIDNEVNDNKSVKNLVEKFETIGKDVVDSSPPVVKAPKFFFGPSSGFSFKAPTPVKSSVTMGFGASFAANATNSKSTVTFNSEVKDSVALNNSTDVNIVDKLNDGDDNKSKCNQVNDGEHNEKVNEEVIKDIDKSKVEKKEEEAVLDVVQKVENHDECENDECAPEKSISVDIINESEEKLVLNEDVKTSVSLSEENLSKTALNNEGLLENDLVEDETCKTVKISISEDKDEANQQEKICQEQEITPDSSALISDVTQVESEVLLAKNEAMDTNIEVIKPNSDVNDARNEMVEARTEVIEGKTEVINDKAEVVYAKTEGDEDKTEVEAKTQDIADITEVEAKTEDIGDKTEVVETKIEVIENKLEVEEKTAVTEGKTVYSDARSGVPEVNTPKNEDISLDTPTENILPSVSEPQTDNKQLNASQLPEKGEEIIEETQPIQETTQRKTDLDTKIEISVGEKTLEIPETAEPSAAEKQDISKDLAHIELDDSKSTDFLDQSPTKEVQTSDSSEQTETLDSELPKDNFESQTSSSQPDENVSSEVKIEDKKENDTKNIPVSSQELQEEEKIPEIKALDNVSTLEEFPSTNPEVPIDISSRTTEGNTIPEDKGNEEKSVPVEEKSLRTPESLDVLPPKGDISVLPSEEISPQPKSDVIEPISTANSEVPENLSEPMKSSDVSMPIPSAPTHSISNLINEVPKAIQVHDNTPSGVDKVEIIPKDNIQTRAIEEQSHLLHHQASSPVEEIPFVKERPILQQAEEKSALEMSNVPIVPIIGVKRRSDDLLDLTCSKSSVSKPETPKNQTEIVDYQISSIHNQYQSPADLMGQVETQMPVLPLEVSQPLINLPYVDKEGLDIIPPAPALLPEVQVQGPSQIEPPIMNYDEGVEQIEEISVAKSFLMEKDEKQTCKTEIADASHLQEYHDHEEYHNTLEEPVIIQEIGSMSSAGYKTQNFREIGNLQEMGQMSIDNQIRPIDEEEDIVKIRQSRNESSVLEINIPKPGVELEKDANFIEVPCKEQKVGLLGPPQDEDDDDDDHRDDMMYDDGNISEPMDLEESKDGEIIEHAELKTDVKNVMKSDEEDSIIPNEKTRSLGKDLAKTEEEKSEEPKKPSLQSFTLDYTGEAPDLSHVHAMARRSLKRGAEEPSKEEEEEEVVTGGKRRKLRGKRAVDKDLRKSIEEAKNKDVSSSDEEKKAENAAPPKAEKKPKQKRKRLLLGLEIPEEGVIQPTGLRQSRRIAQIKIKEEAERRKLEEIALDEMKKSQARKNQKEEEKDKDYKAEKRKRNKIVTEDDTTNDTEIDDKKKKKKKKRKRKEFDEKNPWRTSSDSSSEDSHVEEEEEEEEENYIETVKSDHEFSPESDLENAADPQPLKRARTVRKEDEEEEAVDDTNCQKCNKSDHPEWILLCDGCDAGWHCSCLRPALLVIPEGDWYCPPCQHASLVKLLQDKLQEFDRVQSKKEVELRRKQRLAYVGISLANVLPEKTEDTQKVKKERIRKVRVRISGDEDSSSGSSSSSGSGSGSSSESGSSSSDSDEPIYKLRQRRQEHSYRFKEYDELIKSATQEEIEEKKENEPQIRGKDMATIVQAEMQVHAESGEKKDEEESEDEIKPVKKFLGKKKHRKLNSLDISSEEDEDSDEDFQGSSSDEEDDDDEYNESSSNSSIIGRKRKGRGAVRRSTRARIRRYDREFINDDSEDSDEPRGRRGRSDWEESDESEEESDRSWGRRKKRGGGNKNKSVSSIAPPKRKKSKKKEVDDSDPDVYKKKKPKIKFGGLDDDDDDDAGKRRTRGKKINYLDALGTDSEEESARRRNQVKEEESEDEFVLHEEEEDVQDDEGREDASSDDSNIGGLVPAVKKGSKKGKGKGGIKRIKRAQGEEQEALFPPLENAADSAALTEETTTIEQINKNLEEMDEKEIGVMMEDEEYANRQLQMVAAQLEKEKRRKEMEAKKLEMMQTQPPPVPIPIPVAQEHIATGASVIQTMPAAVPMPPQMMQQVPPGHLHPMHPGPEQLQPIHHDLPLPIHHQLSMHHGPAQGVPIPHHSPQHLIHHPHQLPPQHAQPPMMVIPPDTPKKRGRKPKSQLMSPDGVPPQAFIPTPPMAAENKSDESDMSFNADGTPKKRRGRGKGKKTLEKEAAAAAALASVVQPSPPTQPPAVPVVTKPSVPEPKDEKLLVESKPKSAEIPPIVGGKLGVASAPQPFSQSQPKPSVITRMLQNQPCQPAYPVGGVTHNFDRSQEPRQGLPFVPGGPGLPPRGLHPGAFRPAANHYPVIRSGAPPIRPPIVPPHIFHHSMENPPMPDRRSPALTPSSTSAPPLTSKNTPTPPPPASYAVRPPMVRFPPTSAAPPGGMPPRLPQMLPQMHPRPPYPNAPPHNYHYPPAQYIEGGPPYQPPPHYQEQQFAGDPDGPKNYPEEEENGEFGGLVSYFSSQREDDMDT